MQAKSKVFGFAGAALLGAATFLTPQTALAEKKGQDFPGEKCQRNNKDGSTTTGQCASVCKDLDVSTTKDVNSGLRTCEQKEARTVGGWGLVAVTGNSSVQFLRFNETGEVQACALTSKTAEMHCRHVTIRETQAQSSQ